MGEITTVDLLTYQYPQKDSRARIKSTAISLTLVDFRNTYLGVKVGSVTCESFTEIGWSSSFDNNKLVTRENNNGRGLDSEAGNPQSVVLSWSEL